MKRLRLIYKHLLLVSFFIIILSAIIFISTFFIPKKDPSPPDSVLDCNDFDCTTKHFLNEQQVIEGRLKEEDPAKIYADILAKYADSSPNNQHGIAHIFGEALYKSKGPSALTTCDNSFAFGCFHGFLMNAILEGGIDTIQELDRMCIEKYGEYSLGCQHGLGHGIAEYYGSSNLNQALDTCSTLSWKHKLMGCTGGVFMEYIMPTLSGKTPGSVEVKPINASNPYTPCIDVKDQFKPECFYNLGNYYYHAVDKDSKEVFKLCENIADPFNRKTCLLGFGNSIYSNLRDIPKTISQCQLASTKASEINCRSGAAWILYTNVSSREDAQKLCQGLNGMEFKQCQKDANLLQLALET